MQFRLWPSAALAVSCAACAGRSSGIVLQPPTTCEVPAAGIPVDTSHSANVVGNGTPASCTPAALQAAVNQGGIVTFNCGPSPVTITVTQPIVINNVAGPERMGDTVIDGANLVTLSGGGTSRILYLNACRDPYISAHCISFPHPQLTVQNLTFVDAADNSPDGGGAIYREGGAIIVIHCKFFRNRCATSGPDTAGAALRLVQGTPALVVDSVFGAPGQGNQCSNGGGIGAQNATPLIVINTIIDSNSATGFGGDPGNGGNGGGIYIDGGPLDFQMCGVILTHSTGNAYGGGLFYADELGLGTVHIANSEISNNSIPAQTQSGQFSEAGAAYFQGADVTVTNTTVADNSATYTSGLFVRASQNGHGSFNATNLTVANMPGDGLTLADGVGGTLLNCTVIANTTGISGAGAMTLTNTLVIGNSTNCSGQPTSGGGSFQFPDTSCGEITSADPLLSALQDNGGTTHVRTMAPAANSPALASGNGCPSTDARGQPRPPKGCTSGAYQAQ